MATFPSGPEENQQLGGSAHSRRLYDGDPANDRPASTLVVEIDRFDSIGSGRRRRKVVDQVSWVITDTMRGTDAVYRCGESEFCVVMAQTSENEALGAANRLRSNVASMPLLAEAGITVTVSVAAGSEAELDWSLARAEQAISAPHAANRVIRAADPVN